MISGDNHYDFLGLSMSASEAEVEAAVERLSEQAIALVYTSPERSAALWERIRQIRRDLLAGAEGRQVYDEALLRRQALAAHAAASPIVVSPALAEAPIFATPPAEVVAQERRRRTFAWPYALGAAAAIFLAVATTLVTRGPSSAPASRPQALSLSQSGFLRGSKFASGGHVSLHWSRLAGASRYRLQVASTPGDPSDAVAFSRGARTYLTKQAGYTLTVTGAQVYYWRVQAQVGGHWQPYTHSRHFAVARPAIAMPVTHTPQTGVASGGAHVRLCWSAVDGAVAYRLKVQSIGTKTVHSTCASLSVHARTYRWSVAAVVSGAQLYTGTYSVAQQFKITPSHSHTSVLHTRRAMRLHRPTTNVRSGKVAVATRHKTPTTRGANNPVEVAIASPAQRVRPIASSFRSTRISVTGTAQRSARPAVAGRHSATSRKPTYRLPAGTGGSPANPSSSKPAVGAPSRPNPTATHRIPPVSATPPRTRTTPVVAAGPPAPPPPPTSAPTTAAVPTSPASAATLPTSSPVSVQGVIVKQAVVPASTGGSSPSPTSAPTPAAVQPQPSPTSAQPSPQHPAHPAHPEHPEHPEHPAHP